MAVRASVLTRAGADEFSTAEALRFLGMGGRPTSCVGTLAPRAPEAAVPAAGGPPRRGRCEKSTRVRVEAHVYRRDIRIKIRGAQPVKAPRDGKLDENGVPVPKATRKGVEIKKFSKDSAKSLRFVIQNSADLFSTLVTLTYPGDWRRVAGNGRQIKRHINAFCQWLRRLKFCASCGYARQPKSRHCPCCPTVAARETSCTCLTKKAAYIWVLEFQKRGAPHFHFTLNGKIEKEWLSRRWWEIVGSGLPEHLRAGTQIKPTVNADGLGEYLGSYVSKLRQKQVPEGFRSVGRFWGASRMLGRVIYGFEAEYAAAARALRAYRAKQTGSLRTISEHQGQRGLDKYAEAAAATDPTKKRLTLRCARACERRAHSYARRWRWRGRGFIVLQGARFFKAMLARQAVIADAGPTGPTFVCCDCDCCRERNLFHGLERRASLLPGLSQRVDLWRVWEDEPKKRKDFVPPALRGQLMLDGLLEPECTPDMDAVVPGYSACGCRVCGGRLREASKLELLHKPCRCEECLPKKPTEEK